MYLYKYTSMYIHHLSVARYTVAICRVNQITSIYYWIFRRYRIDTRQRSKRFQLLFETAFESVPRTYSRNAPPPIRRAVMRVTDAFRFRRKSNARDYTNNNKINAPCVRRSKKWKIKIEVVRPLGFALACTSSRKLRRREIKRVASRQTGQYHESSAIVTCMTCVPGESRPLDFTRSTLRLPTRTSTER